MFSQLEEPAHDQISIGPPLPEKDYLKRKPAQNQSTADRLLPSEYWQSAVSS